jgi:hypothetical protein
MVLGWRAVHTNWTSATPHKTLLEMLLKLLAVQHQRGAGDNSGNKTFLALDANRVETDELLWPEDRPQPDGEGFTVPEVPGHLPIEDQEKLRSVLEEFREVFDRHLQPGGANGTPMELEMQPGWEPPMRAARRKYSPAVVTAIQQDLKEQLALGILCLSAAAVGGSPVHMVVKPSAKSGYGFCVDFSVLNKSVVTNPFPLPNIQAIIEEVGERAKHGKLPEVFGLLDLRCGYW